MTSKGRLLLLLPLFLVLACGCGLTNKSAPAKLSGKVTYKGKPLTGGTITLYPPSGGVYAITIKEDGSYSGADLPTGEMPVSIETMAVKAPTDPVDPKTKQKYQMSPRPGAENASAPAAVEQVKIPAKYAKKETSNLSVTLGPGKQAKDFDLTD
jgi:hypothetical protein